jgi:exodeoxyribonuclease VII small subunit
MAAEKISYSVAISQIEQILKQIENDDLDVDQLAEKVKRVSYLLKLCKSRLFDTEKEIDKILKEMDTENVE